MMPLNDTVFRMMALKDTVFRMMALKGADDILKRLG